MRYCFFPILFTLTLSGCDLSAVENLIDTAKNIQAELKEEISKPLSTLSLQEVDYRQLEEYQGLLYKVGTNDPFTGIIKNQPAPNLMGQTVGSCRIEIHDGLPEGTSTCFNNRGIKVSETQYAQGQKNGVEKIWDQNTQHLVKEYHWAYNEREGSQKEFDGKTGKPTSEFTLVNGRKSGLEKAWVTLGQQSFFVTNNYTNGVKNGATEVRDSQSRITSKGVYINGRVLTKTNQTWGEDGTLIQVKRETRDDPNYQGGYPVPEFVLDGSQYECQETFYCYTTEWTLGEQLSGTFRYQKEGEASVSYSGVLGPNGNLVKEGVEHFFAPSDSGTTEQVTVVWNRGSPESIQVTSGNKATTVNSYPNLNAGFFEPSGIYHSTDPDRYTDRENELDKSILVFITSKGYGASDEYRDARETARDDFNQDGIEDAVVLISIENAQMGNSTARQLIYFQGTKTGFTHVDSVYVATSTAMALQEDNSLLLTSLVHGPDDPRCCPTQQSSKQYLIHNNRIFAGSGL